MRCGFAAVAICGGLVLAGCATARNETPAGTWQSEKTYAEIAECLIPAMNESVKQKTPLHAEITHRLDTIIPSVSFEVVTQRQTMDYGDVYVVKLESAGQGTQVTLMAIGVFRNRLRPVVAGCV